jgi:hypothetical protein
MSAVGNARSLAVVVIGGLISSTLLMLIVLPVLDEWMENWSEAKFSPAKSLPDQSGNTTP